MAKKSEVTNPEVLQAFLAYERDERINNTKVGCILVASLMPAGSFLDFFAYPSQLNDFAVVRLACSAFAIALLIWLYSPLVKRYPNALGNMLALVPSAAIAWMIAVTEGFNSPYYVGLILVLIAIGAVLRWTLYESLVATLAIFVLYVGAGLWRGQVVDLGEVFNNLFFLLLMGVIVVVGAYFQHQQRFREFALRHELDQSHSMLEESNLKLRELDEVKSRFFANISHELRTPLTLVIAPLDKLAVQLQKLGDEQVNSLLSTMQANGMRLLKLINDLLDLVRMESGQMTVDRIPIDLSNFISGMIQAVSGAVEDRGLRTEMRVADEINRVMADSDKLEKILLNLLFNSIKFTPAGGLIKVAATKEKDVLFITVRDTGMGIEKEKLAYIFDRFWQADTSAKRKSQGAGIGLALVKELVEVQGGSVSVESREGEGTQFTVQLPYLESDEPIEDQTKEVSVGTPEAVPSSNGKNEEWLRMIYRRAELFPSMQTLRETIRQPDYFKHGTKPKVLIADDEPDMLSFLNSQLNEHYIVYEAVDGAQAVEKARQFLPDVILLDMMMPEKDGLAVCRELKGHTPTRSIPVVLLTARADERAKLSALEAGASDFLTKPFSSTELQTRLGNLVVSYHYQRELTKMNADLENSLEELKETETQLVQAEKLASLGRLSAGIIHEINNPLNYAKTGLYVLNSIGDSLEPEAKEEFKDIFTDVQDGIDRVANIVSDLRTFTHPDTRQRDLAPVNDIVQAALRFLSSEIKDNVDIIQDLPEDMTIYANPNQITQVLLNLIQNAIDALRQKEFSDDEPTVTISGNNSNGTCSIVVRDNGPGIPEENLGRIFDPFFTTKEIGQGMGLGLSICYRILEQNGGQIRVHSRLGEFSEFTLELADHIEPN